MIAVKIALLVLLMLVPVTPVLLSLPVISVVVVVALAAAWLLIADPRFSCIARHYYRQLAASKLSRPEAQKMPVRVVFEDVTPEVTLPKFRPI